MKKATALLACLGLSTAVAAAAANNYLADRKFEGMRTTPITRVYIGRGASSRCPQSTLEQCLSAVAIRAPLKCQPRAAGIWQCLGTKKLFRGTGTDNKALGLESLDLQVRDGNIVGESVVVQMVETLQLGAQPESAELRCEGFGDVGLSSCDGVEPILPLPPTPDAGPTFSRAYSNSELSNIAGTVQMLQYCLQSTPELRAEGERIYRAWRGPRADVAEFMETALADDIAKTVARTPSNAVGSQEYEQCGEVYTAFDAQSRAPDPRFKTPQSTWSALKAALARGDAKAAASCFANPYGSFGRMFSQFSPQDLVHLGKSLVRFDMIKGDMKDYRTGLVERDDGISAEVLFVKMGEEWRIAQM